MTAQEVRAAALHALDNMDDLDNYLDTMMLDQTMSITKTKRAGTWGLGMLTVSHETNDMTGCVG
jgi:hypothetical protein